MKKKIASTIRCYNSEIVFEEELEKHLDSVAEFDLRGRLIGETNYNYDGEIVVQNSYEYEGEKIVQEDEFDHEKGTHVITRRVFENELKVSEIVIFDEVNYLKTIFSYNTENRLIRMENIDGEGEFLGLIVFTYMGNKVLEKRYDEENKLAVSSTYYQSPDDIFEHGIYVSHYEDEGGKSRDVEEYDSFGNHIKSQSFSYGDVFESETLMEYDANNNIDRVVIKDSAGDIIEEINFSYNEENQELFQNSIRNGELFSTLETEYNSNGDIIKKIAKKIVEGDDFISTKLATYEIEYYK